MRNEMNESEQKTYELQPNKLVDGEKYSRHLYFFEIELGLGKR
jgi:hypothetical protein